MKSGVERRRQDMDRAMIKTLVLSILLFVVMVTAWFVDMIRYHERRPRAVSRRCFRDGLVQVVAGPQSVVAD
jgi:hypothetical protein